MFKKERGITLVALVITIVVLLILAGVTITSLSGNENIIKKAKEARDVYVNDETHTQETLNTTDEILANILNNEG